MKNHVNNAAGFTLIEVLIALMILAIALTAAIVSSQNSIRTTNHLRNQLAAHWVAMNVLSRMQIGLVAPPSNGSTGHGEAKMLGSTFEWTAGIEREKNIYYKRIYINVRKKGSTSQLEHLIGFVTLGSKKNNEILSK